MKRLLLTSVLALLMCWPSTVNGGKAERRRARKYFKLGKRLFKQKKYNKAIVQFKKAQKLWKHRVIQFNIALSYAFLGKKIEAAKHLKQYLKGASAAERNLPDILLKVQQETGTLIIQVPDPTAAIYVDGQFVGNGRVELILPVGKHGADIRVGKVVVANRTIVVPPAGEKVWELAEVPRPTRPIRPTRRTRRVGWRPGPEPPTPTPTPAPRGLGRLHWAYFATAVVLTAGALGTGLAMYFQTEDVRDKYNDGGKTDSSLRKKGIRYYNITNAMWGVTGGMAATAIVLGIFTRWRKKPETEKGVSVMPGLSPGSVGLTLRLDY
jgi:hypothetical protein